jgi:glutamate-1-semialdehyde aminotransferase
MGDSVKFSSKMEAGTLEALRAYSREQGRTVAAVLGEAVQEYLQRARVRPAFREAAQSVMVEHDELLRRLAK